MHPSTQHSTQACSSPALQVPAFLGDIEDPQAALLGCAVCALTLVAYCAAQVLYPEMQKKRIEKARRHRWAVAAGACASSRQRVCQGRWQLEQAKLVAYGMVLGIEVLGWY